MASKVYFTNFRCEGNENLLQKFRRLCETAGVGSIDMKDKYVAVKMHFGEPGNIAFLRHNYARALCDLIREHGGRCRACCSPSGRDGRRARGSNRTARGHSCGAGRRCCPARQSAF